MVAVFGQNITRDKETLRCEKVRIQQRVFSCGVAYYLSINIAPN